MLCDHGRTMTTLRKRIVDDLTAAMKAKDAQKLAVVRMLKSRIMEAEVDCRVSKGPGYELSDEETTGVIAAYAKQRRDSIDAYVQAGRNDLADKERAELALIQEYLPAQLSEDDVRAIVADAIRGSGAASPKDMGAVMKLVMPKVKGQADGKLVNKVVQELLSKPGS